MREALRIKDKVDAGRHTHPTDRRKHGKRCLAGAPELAHNHFILKLNTHEQEKYCHQKVVDERLKSHPRGK